MYSRWMVSLPRIILPDLIAPSFWTLTRVNTNWSEKHDWLRALINTYDTTLPTLLSHSRRALGNGSHDTRTLSVTSHDDSDMSVRDFANVPTRRWNSCRPAATSRHYANRGIPSAEGWEIQRPFASATLSALRTPCLFSSFALLHISTRIRFSLKMWKTEEKYGAEVNETMTSISKVDRSEIIRVPPCSLRSTIYSFESNKRMRIRYSPAFRESETSNFDRYRARHSNGLQRSVRFVQHSRRDLQARLPYGRGKKQTRDDRHWFSEPVRPYSA